MPSILARRLLGLSLVLTATVTGACGTSTGSAPRGSSTTAATASPTTTGQATTSTVAAPWTSGCAQPVAEWPVEARLEQMIMVSGQFTGLSSSAPQASAGVGGFVLFGQPPAGARPAIANGLAALAADATADGFVVPWMSTDEEGGEVARLAEVIGALPAPRQMAAQWTPAQVEATMASQGAAMRALGMTMDLAPVLDTASPTDTVADENERSFSDDPQTVAAYGTADAAGLHSAGVVAVAKHFPGLGHASADTDLGPATDPPLSQLRSDDLIPFEDAISAGIPVVMVGHPVVPGLSEGLPASLSSATYVLLRQTLHFTGVTLTDSLGAGAISAAGYSEQSAAVAAAEAGADMVMIDASSWSATVEALGQAVADGRLPLSSVDASVSRILTAKGVPRCAS